jgi:hypothetical protein
MIQGLTALLPIINKAVDLVPDKNKVAQHIDLPTLDSSTLMTVLFSLLGLTGARSFDKLKKISHKK